MKWRSHHFNIGEHFVFGIGSRKQINLHAIAMEASECYELPHIWVEFFHDTNHKCTNTKSISAHPSQFKNFKSHTSFLAEFVLKLADLRIVQARRVPIERGRKIIGEHGEGMMRADALRELSGLIT